MFLTVSFLLAFFATAGAIPLCRSMRKRFEASAQVLPVEAPPVVAGAGMMVGILIALFYVPTDGSDALSGILDLASAPPVGTLLLILVIMTPLAAYFVGRPKGNSPALTSGLALVQLLFLLIIVLISRIGAPGEGADTIRNALHGFTNVAVPTTGALVAALIYLCPAPWRPHALVSVGGVTRIYLGLLVAWGTLAIANLGLAGPSGGVSPSPLRDSSYLLWILVVPAFELLNRWLIAPSRYGRLLPPHHPLAIIAFTVIGGGASLAVWHLRLTGFWLEAAILPALLAYLLSQRFISPSGLARHQSAIVGARRQVAR